MRGTAVPRAGQQKYYVGTTLIRGSNPYRWLICSTLSVGSASAAGKFVLVHGAGGSATTSTIALMQYLEFTTNAMNDRDHLKHRFFNYTVSILHDRKIDVWRAIYVYDDPVTQVVALAKKGWIQAQASKLRNVKKAAPADFEPAPAHMKCVSLERQKHVHANHHNISETLWWFMDHRGLSEQHGACMKHNLARVLDKYTWDVIGLEADFDSWRHADPDESKADSQRQQKPQRLCRQPFDASFPILFLKVSTVHLHLHRLAAFLGIDTSRFPAGILVPYPDRTYTDITHEQQASLNGLYAQLQSKQDELQGFYVLDCYNKTKAT